MERSDSEAEVLGNAQEHQNLVRPVAMSVHENAAIEDPHERLESEVSSRRHRIFSARFRVFVGLPLGLVFLRLGEARSQRELDSHAGGGVARRDTIRRPAVGSFWIFAERELDPRLRSLDEEIGRVFAPAQLDHCVLATDDVGRAVEHVDGCDPTGESTQDRGASVVDHVGDADFGGNRTRGLVVVTGDSDVNVSVDDARHHEHAGRIDFPRARGDGDVVVATHCLDRAVP